MGPATLITPASLRIGALALVAALAGPVALAEPAAEAPGPAEVPAPPVCLGFTTFTGVAASFTGQIQLYWDLTRRAQLAVDGQTGMTAYGTLTEIRCGEENIEVWLQEQTTGDQCIFTGRVDGAAVAGEYACAFSSGVTRPFSGQLS
ncbi:MAG: hypothetical protein AAF909_06755 [Pseudomonadota bacterium]